MPNNELWAPHDYNEFQFLPNQTYNHENPSASPEIQIQNEDYGSQATYLTSRTRAVMEPANLDCTDRKVIFKTLE